MSKYRFWEWWVIKLHIKICWSWLPLCLCRNKRHTWYSKVSYTIWGVKHRKGFGIWLPSGPQSWLTRAQKPMSLLRPRGVWLECLPSEPQGSPLSELPGVKGQEPRARPQPEQLTVMLKDHTQQPDLWGLHRTWAELSNKAVYSLSVYLCPAFRT